MARSNVKVGIIGCGNISYRHINDLMRIPEAEVLAISDIDESKMEKLKESFPVLRGVETFTDYLDMLESADLDAVEILTPHSLHFKQAMECLDKGLHVLIEKPMVCTIREAEELISKSERVKRQILVSYQRHYQPKYRWIKNLINSGGIGVIQYISAMQCQNWLNIARGTWRQNPRLSCGGQLYDSASHLFDFILWSTGLKPVEVSAFSDNLGMPVDINSSVSIKFDNGAQANIGIIGNSPCFREDVAFFGSKGAIFFLDDELECQLFDEDVRVEPVRLPSPSNPDRNFINVILGRERNESPPICGLKVVMLTEAIIESYRRGERVKLDG